MAGLQVGQSRQDKGSRPRTKQGARIPQQTDFTPRSSLQRGFRLQRLEIEAHQLAVVLCIQPAPRDIRVSRTSAARLTPPATVDRRPNLASAGYRDDRNRDTPTAAS